MAVTIKTGTTAEARRELSAYVMALQALECDENGLTVLYIVDADDAEMCRDMEHNQVISIEEM